MAINSITAYWDNDFDRRFDEAVDELERLEKEKKEGGDE